jgi:hypothetical protein
MENKGHPAQPGYPSTEGNAWQTNNLKPKWQNECRDCHETIGFHPEVRGKNGKCRPLNLDGSRHECPNSDYARKEKAAKGNPNDERLVFEAVQKISEYNKSLQTCHLRIIREDRK